jgi:DNA mismatch repair protein MSH6
LKKLPDLQRTISRIHAGHVTLAEFVSVLDAFEHVQVCLIWKCLADLVQTFMVEIQSEIDGFTSARLRHITKLDKGLPQFNEQLSRLCDSFERATAMSTGRITPKVGFAPEYDAAINHVTALEQELAAHLKYAAHPLTRVTDTLRAQQAHFKSSKVVYKDLGKELYLLEVPAELLSKHAAPAGYITKSRTAVSDTCQPSSD